MVTYPFSPLQQLLVIALALMLSMSYREGSVMRESGG
jgi:hypothetical protein